MLIEQFQYSGDEAIDQTARQLSEIVFEGITRRNGEPYTKHNIRINEKISQIILDNQYKQPQSAGGWLHDVPEDNVRFDVYNPYDPPADSMLSPDIIYINHLFQNGNDKGNFLSYFVYKMTRRAGENYALNMVKKFSFAPIGKQLHELDVLSGILKMFDRGDNCRPTEKPGIEHFLQEYMQLENSEERDISKYLAQQKLLHKFNGDISWNPERFKEIFESSFYAMLKANAHDNLFFYIPMAETAVLVPYHEKEQSLFDYSGFRNHLKSMMIDSLHVYGDPKVVDIMRHGGFYKGNCELKNYPDILTEVCDEINCASLPESHQSVHRA